MELRREYLKAIEKSLEQGSSYELQSTKNRLVDQAMEDYLKELDDIVAERDYAKLLYEGLAQRDKEADSYKVCSSLYNSMRFNSGEKKNS